MIAPVLDDPVWKYLLRRFKATFPGSKPTMITFDYGNEVGIALYPKELHDPENPKFTSTFHKIMFEVQHGETKLVTKKNQAKWFSVAMGVVSAANEGLEKDSSDSKYPRCKVTLRLFG